MSPPETICNFLIVMGNRMAHDVLGTLLLESLLVTVLKHVSSLDAVGRWSGGGRGGQFIHEQVIQQSNSKWRRTMAVLLVHEFREGHMKATGGEGHASPKSDSCSWKVETCLFLW